jgi:hypothetical protein
MSWFDPKRMANGKIRIPRRAEGTGGMVGDAVTEIGPDDPEYAKWDDALREQEQRSTSS